MLNTGYNFYFKDGEDVLTFPITPGELNITVGSNNKTVTLINEGDINILKSPALVEVTFEARFPMRKYPYSKGVSSFQTYFDKFKELKEQKKSFRFIVTRTGANGVNTWDTNLLVALETMDLKESADQGDDVLITFKLKQFKEYGVRIIKLKDSESTSTSTSSSETTRTEENAPTPTDKETQTTTPDKTYTIKKNDTLWSIAKKYYGQGSKYKKLYQYNKKVLDKAAQIRGYASSRSGQWIWAGTKIKIPAKL